jgi:hypothetical protein
MKSRYFPVEEAHHLYEEELDCLIETIYEIADVVEVFYKTQVPTFPISVAIKDKYNSECKPWTLLYQKLEQYLTLGVNDPIHIWGPIFIAQFKKWQDIYCNR